MHLRSEICLCIQGGDGSTIPGGVKKGRCGTQKYGFVGMVGMDLMMILQVFFNLTDSMLLPFLPPLIY